MWIQPDESLKRKVLNSNDVDTLYLNAKILYNGNGEAARNLDLAVEGFIRAAEKGSRKALHFLHLINRNNEAAGDAKERIKEILRKTDPYHNTVGMLGGQARLDLQELFLYNEAGSPAWQKALERLRLAAEKKDPRSQWELALHYMVGRGCRKDFTLAGKYSKEAIKEYPLLGYFIGYHQWGYELPSLEEVLNDPQLILAPPNKLNSPDKKYYMCNGFSAIFYPELFLRRIYKVSYSARERFLAIWPCLYPFFEFSPFKKIPYDLLWHQPQFAELLPIIWSHARKNDIYLVNRHQKLERYIKAEQFDNQDFAKVLSSRPEYIKLMNIEELTRDDVCKILNSKIKQHRPRVLSPEERILTAIADDGKRMHDSVIPVVRWMEGVIHFSGDPRFFQDRIGYEEAAILQQNEYAYEICLAQNIPCALEIRDLNKGRIVPPYSPRFLENPFSIDNLRSEVRQKFNSPESVTLEPSLFSPVYAFHILENKVEEFRNYRWKIPGEVFFEKVINMGIPQIQAVDESFAGFADFLINHSSLLTVELGEKLYAAGIGKGRLLKIYRQNKELLPRAVLLEHLPNKMFFNSIDWDYILQKRPEFGKIFFAHFKITDPNWENLSNEQYEKIISRFPYLYKFHKRDLPVSVLKKVFTADKSFIGDFDFSKLSDEEYEKLISHLPDLYRFHKRSLPIPVLMKVFAADESFISEFDFSTFTGKDWLEIIFSYEHMALDESPAGEESDRTIDPGTKTFGGWVISGMSAGSFPDRGGLVRDKILSDAGRYQMFFDLLDFELLAAIYIQDGSFFFEKKLYLHEKWQSSLWGGIPVDALKRLHSYLEMRKFPADPKLLSDSVWYSFVLENPVFFHYAPCKFTRSQLRSILCSAGPILKDVFDSEFAAGNIQAPHVILLAHPEMIDENNKHALANVTSSRWSHELRTNAALAKYCPWDKLTKDNWETLLLCQPRYAEKCPILSTLELSSEIREKIRKLFPNQ